MHYHRLKLSPTKSYAYIKNRDKGLHIVYRNMKIRCRDKSHSSYKNYGGRGISVVWNSYKEFKSDMLVSYLEHLEKFGKMQTQIDRIDNDGNYCKNNCRWATRKEQAKNKRANQL